MSARARSALILAGGAGKRMQAGGDPSLGVDQSIAARRGDKAFMPVAGRTFIDYQIDVLESVGITEVCVVVAADRVISGPFVTTVQARPLGTANAVWSARAWAGEWPFLVLNGDNLYPATAIDAVASLDGPGLAGFDRDDLIATSNIPPERITALP